MGNRSRAAAQALAVLLLTVGIPPLLLGLILRETRLLGAILIAGGGYCVLHGCFLLLEAWWSGRGDY